MKNKNSFSSEKKKWLMAFLYLTRTEMLVDVSISVITYCNLQLCYSHLSTFTMMLGILNILNIIFLSWRSYQPTWISHDSYGSELVLQPHDYGSLIVCGYNRQSTNRNDKRGVFHFFWQSEYQTAPSLDHKWKCHFLLAVSTWGLNPCSQTKLQKDVTEHKSIRLNTKCYCVLSLDSILYWIDL